MANAPVSSAVSFPLKEGSSSTFQQNFNSRGFPVVAAAGAINAIYIGNGRSYRAITMTSVGGIRSWWWEEDQWVAPSK
jgi:hypothetical protein